MLKDFFEDALIKKIAIIDDDLSLFVTLDDIRSKDDNIANALADPDDPDREELDKLLEESGIENKTIEDLVESLKNDDIRDKAPKRFRNIYNEILDTRKDQARPLHKLCNWLSEEGINSAEIDVFTSPDEKIEDQYDLILVDYFLVGDDKEQTLPLIKRLLEKHKDFDKPLLIILMSSHEAQLKTDFSSLRPELGITSSRFRIMKKPMDQSDDERIQWLLTLQQLAQERKVIFPVEIFLKAWGGKMKAASAKLADGLWELDAHSLEILRQSAEDDHAYFEDYLIQILSRRIQAEVEESGFPFEETKNLSKILSSEKETLSYGTEVADSREALRKLLGDVSWKRQQSWEATTIPTDNTDRFYWIKKYIKFGCVLKDDSGRLFVHVTQPCDLAHIEYDNRNKQNLLFFPGELVKTDRRINGDKEHCSEAYFYDDEWRNIHWQLTRPQTFSFNLLINSLDKYTIVGQLRKNQTQGLINNYAAKCTRVAEIRIPSFSLLTGKIINVRESLGNYFLVDNNIDVECTLYKEKFINFDLEEALIVANNIDAKVDKEKLVSQLVHGSKEKADICGQKVKCLLVPLNIKNDDAVKWLCDQNFCKDQTKLSNIYRNKQNFVILTRS